MNKNVICIKWGTKFSFEYVNRLYKMVEKNLTVPHRFVCFTDDSEGILEEIETRPLPELNDTGLPEKAWKKLGLFTNQLADLEKTRIICKSACRFDRHGTVFGFGYCYKR